MERTAPTQRRSGRAPSRQGGCLGWPPPTPPALPPRQAPCANHRAAAARSRRHAPSPRARRSAPPPPTTLPPPRRPLRWRGRRCAAETSSRRRAGDARVSRNPQPRTLISPQPCNLPGDPPPQPSPSRPLPPPPPLTCYDPPSFGLLCCTWFPIRHRFTATAIRGCLPVCTARWAPTLDTSSAVVCFPCATVADAPDPTCHGAGVAAVPSTPA